MENILNNCIDCSTLQITYHNSNEDGGGNYYPSGYSVYFYNDDGVDVEKDFVTYKEVVDYLDRLNKEYGR